MLVPYENKAPSAPLIPPYRALKTTLNLKTSTLMYSTKKIYLKSKKPSIIESINCPYDDSSKNI